MNFAGGYFLKIGRKSCRLQSVTIQSEVWILWRLNHWALDWGRCVSKCWMLTLTLVVDQTATGTGAVLLQIAVCFGSQVFQHPIPIVRHCWLDGRGSSSSSVGPDVDWPVSSGCWVLQSRPKRSWRQQHAGATVRGNAWHNRHHTLLLVGRFNKRFLRPFFSCASNVDTSLCQRTKGARLFSLLISWQIWWLVCNTTNLVRSGSITDWRFAGGKVALIT